MRWALLLLIGRVANAATPLVFDAREPDRPKVAVTIGGTRTVWLLVDTGNFIDNVIGPEAARRLRLPTGLPASLGRDVDNRGVVGYTVAAPVEIPGLGTAGDTVAVSKWALEHRGLDGVLAPSHLVRRNEAVVIDFVSGTLTRVSWLVAERQLGTLPRQLVDTPLVRGHAFVTAFVDGVMKSLIVDTGSPITTVYEPRARDLPRSATRSMVRAMPVEVAGFHLNRVDVRQQAARVSDDADGLLGMDVLRRCALAFDERRMLVRCSDGTPPAQPLALSRPTPIRHASGPDRSLEVGFAGPKLSPYKKGWLACARKECVYLHSDGKIQRPARNGRREDPDTHQLLDDIADLRAELHEADDAERIEVSLTRLPDHLARVWAERRWTIEERRQFLFEIWDECLERSDRHGDAGSQGRRIVELFVREQLPRGSDDAFSDAELQRFNAQRHSEEPFNPYEPAVHVSRR
jgi:hypothetical protein